MNSDYIQKAAIAAAALLATTVACAPDGALDGDDEDSADDSDSIIGGSPATAYPEAALVNMMWGGQISSICSGAVIAPRVVLTAGHCVVGGYTAWNIVAPYANNQTANASSAATFDYTDQSGYVNPNQHDVGLVFLDTPINLPSWPTVASTAAPNGSSLQNIGRINNGTASWSNLFLGPSITFSNGSNYGYPLSYVSTMKIQPGDSGGLVVGSGGHTIYAVNSGAGGGTQILARVDLVINWINQQVAAHGGYANAEPDPGDPDPGDPDPGDPDPGDPDPGDPDPGDPDPGDPDPDDCPQPDDPPPGDQQPHGVPGGPSCYGLIEACDTQGETFLYCDGQVLRGVECGDIGKTCIRLTTTDAVCM